MSKWYFELADWSGLALAATVMVAAFQVSAQSTPAIAVAPQVAPHPLSQGMTVVDRSGEAVGVITAVADSERGPMVIVKVDGKLVSIPQSTLTLDGTIVRSSQAKAQILAASAAH